MTRNLLRFADISCRSRESGNLAAFLYTKLDSRVRGNDSMCQPFTQTSVIRALAFCLILAGVNVAEAQSLGRLFFTPKERAVLDRTGTGQPAELVEVKPLEPKRPAEINGFVKRSNGKDTIWIDGQPLYGSEPLHVSPSAVRTPGGPIVVRRPSHADADTPGSRQR